MRISWIVLLLLALVSCSSQKPKPEAFTTAERSIDAAVLAGAEQHSPVELQFAREKLAEAHKGIEHKQYDKSFYLIEQSEINSELAIEKTRASIVRARVAEATRQNEILREDLQHTLGDEFE